MPLNGSDEVDVNSGYGAGLSGAGDYGAGGAGKSSLCRESRHLTEVNSQAMEEA